MTLVNEVETRNSLSVVTVMMDVLPVGGVVNLLFETILNPEHQEEGNFSEPIFANYTTIQQEGIGLEVTMLAYIVYVWQSQTCRKRTL